MVVSARKQEHRETDNVTGYESPGMQYKELSDIGSFTDCQLRTTLLDRNAALPSTNWCHTPVTNLHHEGQGKGDNSSLAEGSHAVHPK